MSKWSVQSSECHWEFRVCVGCQYYQLLLNFRFGNERLNEKNDISFVHFRSVFTRKKKELFIWIYVSIICAWHNEPFRFIVFRKIIRFKKCLDMPVMNKDWKLNGSALNIIRYGDIFCKISVDTIICSIRKPCKWIMIWFWPMYTTIVHYPLCILCVIVKLLDKMLHESMSNWKHCNQSKGFGTSNILTFYNPTYWYWCSLLTLQTVPHHIRCKRNDRKTLNCMLYWYV